MRELSGWQQVTGVPKSARQAEMTVPRYPAPYTPICITPPACPTSAGPRPNLLFTVRMARRAEYARAIDDAKRYTRGACNRYGNRRRVTAESGGPALGQHPRRPRTWMVIRGAQNFPPYF